MRATSFSTLPLLLVPFFAAACGGTAFTTSDDGGSGGASSSGGADASGGSGTGGAPPSGGASSGGSPGTGGTASGGGTSVDTSCSSTSQCTVVESSCCSACQRPTADQMVAIRVDQRDEFQQEVCGRDPPACPACEGMPNPNLFAQCVRGNCEVQDLTDHEEAACNNDDDCRVIPAACCNCNAGNSMSEIVAISAASGNFQEAQCATSVTPICGDCTWEPPSGVTATCVGGYCALNSTLDGM